MVPIDQVYAQPFQPQQQQRPSLIIQQPNVVPAPPNTQYITYDPSVAYQPQPQNPNYPQTQTFITFNPNVPNWQPQQQPQQQQQQQPPQQQTTQKIAPESQQQAQIIPQQQSVLPTIPQQQQQPPLKRERKPIIITDPNTHEAINLKDKVNKTESSSATAGATTAPNTDNNNKQSSTMTTSNSNRSLNNNQQKSSSTTPQAANSAPISTNTQEAKAIQLDFSLSVLKKINESSNKTITTAASPPITSTPQQPQIRNNESTEAAAEHPINKSNVPKTSIAVGRQPITIKPGPTSTIKTGKRERC